MNKGARRAERGGERDRLKGTRDREGAGLLTAFDDDRLVIQVQTVLETRVRRDEGAGVLVEVTHTPANILKPCRDRKHGFSRPVWSCGDRDSGNRGANTDLSRSSLNHLCLKRSSTMPRRWKSCSLWTQPRRSPVCLSRLARGRAP